MLPGLLMLVDLGMIAGPVLFGQVALAHADMLSVLFCLLPLGAFLSNCLSTQTNEDFRCYPLGTYVNSGNMCLYMESLGARQLRDAVLASGRKLHWVDMDLMERVIAYERAQGKRTPA